MNERTLNFARYVFPLVTAVEKPYGLEEISFVGSCFLLNKNGLIATCAHIVEKVSKDRRLFLSDISAGKCFRLENIKLHSFADFAVGFVNQSFDDFLKPYTGSCLGKLGHDVMNFGYTYAAIKGTNVAFDTRISKGYISRMNNERDTTLRCYGICELSFPSFPGCSGSPIVSPLNAEVLGMLYFNLESSIETFSFSEYNEKGELEREKVCRIVEFGLMHTIDDIKTFLKDMSMQDTFV